MRRFAIGFVLAAPLLLWLFTTVALIVTAPIWLSFPSCCAIDDAALLSWLFLLPEIYAVALLPAILVAILIVWLGRRLGRFDSSAMLASLLLGVIGALLVVWIFEIRILFDGSLFGGIALMAVGGTFGILFSTTALSALIARRSALCSCPMMSRLAPAGWYLGRKLAKTGETRPL
jgi:hypothetical protein